ncbi:MAG: hypothetical protein K1Y36_04135 [Blastocatellia bacterium]|nr:hypothetical protein [Blastocatellia bacterium]
MDCTTHGNHTHTHNENCGHTRVQHGTHVDYLHAGHLHNVHGDHVDEHTIEVSAENPAVCAPVTCGCAHNDCGHQTVPHGDHTDFLVNGRLHHPHGDHCDDHGALAVV